MNQLLSLEQGESGQNYARINAQRMVDSYRANARELLFQSVLISRILELLPDVSPGSSALLTSQIQDSRDRWRQALELPPDLVETVTHRANSSVDAALNQAMGDLQSLGYFLPGTIFENGIGQ